MKNIISDDYLEYDYLRLSVKRDKVEQVVKGYNAFLFVEVNRYEDRRFSNLLHLEFKRPHKIKNKDSLQYLQVEYECAINECAKEENEKHYKSQTIASFAVTLAVLAFAGVIALIFFAKTFWHILFGVCVVLIETLLSAILFVRLKAQRKIESERFCEYLKKYRASLDKIFGKVKALTKSECEK